MDMTPLFPVVPQFQWNDRDYANLKGKIYLFEDQMILESYDAGRAGAMYLVDPLDIAARLGGVMGISSGLLPQGCLSYSRVSGEERVIVYVEAQVWPVSVKGETLTWHVPMPPLVVVGQGQSYSIFALKEAGWPGPETPLYAAPCPNLGDRGVCQGNAPFPAASPGTIREAVKAFFGSGFNNHLADNKSKAHPQNVLEQWKRLNKRRAEVYPAADLVEVRIKGEAHSWQQRPMTLSDLASLEVMK